MRVTLGVGVTRAGVDELITGLWTFANILGLLTDEIGERTPNLGVQVDGLVIKDGGIPEAAVTAHEAALAILESQIVDGGILARLAAAETVVGDWTFNAQILAKARVFAFELAVANDQAFVANVTGDTTGRWQVSADGSMAWGDGSASRDTNLFRNAADELKTDDAFSVGGALTALAGLELGISSYSLSAQANNRATGGVVVQRISLVGAQSLSGFVAPAGVGVLFVSTGVTGSALTLLHESASSTAANRIVCPGAANFALPTQGGVLLYYDDVSSRWRFVGHT